MPHPSSPSRRDPACSTCRSSAAATDPSRTAGRSVVSNGAYIPVDSVTSAVGLKRSVRRLKSTTGPPLANPYVAVTWIDSPSPSVVHGESHCPGRSCFPATQTRVGWER